MTTHNSNIEIDYRELSDEITTVVIESLNYFDKIYIEGIPNTFEDVQNSISGSIKRYRSDPIFRAKSQLLVSRIIDVVRRNYDDA